MALLSSRNDKKSKNGLMRDDRVENDPKGKGFVKRSGKVSGTLSNRTGLINGLTIAEQDPAINKGQRSKKAKGGKPKAVASGALLKK